MSNITMEAVPDRYNPTSRTNKGLPRTRGGVPIFIEHGMWLLVSCPAHAGMFPLSEKGKWLPRTRGDVPWGT